MGKLRCQKLSILFKTQSLETVDLGYRDSASLTAGSPLNHCADKCVLETCVSHPMPIANVPSTLANMVFCPAKLPHTLPLSCPRGLVQTSLLNHRGSVYTESSILALPLPAHPAPRICLAWLCSLALSARSLLKGW